MEYLEFKSQGYNPESNMDIFRCTYGKEGNTIELKFKLAWNVMKTMADKMPDYEVVYKNKKLPVYYRLGALLSNDSKADILKEIQRLTD